MKQLNVLTERLRKQTAYSPKVALAVLQAIRDIERGETKQKALRRHSYFLHVKQSDMIKLLADIHYFTPTQRRRKKHDTIASG